MTANGRKKKGQSAPIPDQLMDHGTLETARVRRKTSKQQAQEEASLEKEARKVNRYAHQALRGRQALEEINGFHQLDPESKEQDSDTEFDQDDVFTFKAVAQPSVTRQRAPTQTPRLTQRSTHVPSAPLSRVPPSDDVIDPTFLATPQQCAAPIVTPPELERCSVARGLGLMSGARGPTDMTSYGYLSLATTEGLQVVKKVKVGEGGTRGRLRSADFDKLYAATVHLAISHYQSILANSTIYPNDIQAQDWSGQAWAAACRSQGIQIDFDEDAYKLITECGSNLRSDLKTILRPLVETEFGFSNEKTPEAIKSNAARAATVLANRKLLMCKDREAGKGLFETDIIVDGVIKWCYDKKNSLGATLPSYFKDSTTGGASWGIIAAVLTGIEACVAEWTSAGYTVRLKHKSVQLDTGLDAKSV
ncbi:hypothetical protein DEU56DRAFT_761364 [Suillus clintonianus]|uniref:uncharacterized protein n=1 Tax=Suillus clintonianus TaxID=1904413 RepID=UPI001B8717AD|nr:uncharacterized protein DEU56DRAFT_761364 [Suillus clintonianus]KAG2117576.1 hypothetical protein DEU56DRAFT_761364 [Suillus clintonianus]